MAFTLGAADQPQWGQAWSRNMVSNEKGLPASFDPATGRNVKWSAALGNQTHSSPVIAGGRVYIGTNNENPRDPKRIGDRGVLMCFEEKTGRFLWQLLVPKREEDPFFDWPMSGISSPATIEGDRVYIVSNRGELLCLDAAGLANGNEGPFLDEAGHMAGQAPERLEAGSADADIIWLLDLTREAGIWSHDAAHSSVLIDGNYLYLNSGTGVDNTHKLIRTPNAPSLVVVDKRTGRLVARDDEKIAPQIFHCTWSPPSLGVVGGRPAIFFAAGNGMVYAFETLKETPPKGQVMKLKKIWQFDFDPSGPKENVHQYNKNSREGPSNFYGMPVFFENRLYVAGGGDPFWGKNQAWLKCLDLGKNGAPGPPVEIWSRPLERHVMSTPAIHEGLLFMADWGRLLHCLDARTGEPCWTQEIKGEAWASPLIADGKVYFGTRSGEFWVFRASKQKEVLSSVAFEHPISATAAAANGVLYVATMTTLYALQSR